MHPKSAPVLPSRLERPRGLMAATAHHLNLLKKLMPHLVVNFRQVVIPRFPLLDFVVFLNELFVGLLLSCLCFGVTQCVPDCGSA